MTAAQETAVTYTGRETPFVDRIYRSKLTFNPGQTRLLPALLAAKLLRHAEFTPFVEPGTESVADAKKAEDLQLQEKPVTQDDTATLLDDAKKAEDLQLQEKPVTQDDTATLLDDAKKAEDLQRQQEDARFTLLQQIDKMDKQALRDWTKQTYQQDLPPQLGLEKMRDRVRGFIDQFGAL
ncbi:MAG: hypothetical protein RR857_23865 [Comamonas sp.]